MFTGPVYSNIFLLLWGEIVYRPIFNLLIVFLAIFGGNLGWAIVALTLLVRGMMYKNTMASASMQEGMGNMQPKMQDIQEKFKDDPAKQQEEMMKLLKTQGAGPLKWCMGMLLQIPVFIGLFYVIKAFSQQEVVFDKLYSFLYTIGLDYTTVEGLQTSFFGVDLLTSGNWVLTILAGVLIFAQMKLMNFVKPQAKKPAQTLPNGQAMPDPAKMMWVMNIFMMIMMGGLVYQTASGVGIYIITTTVFTLTQYLIKYRVLLVTKVKAFMRKKDAPEIIG